MASITQPEPSTDDRLRTREYVGYALGDAASNFFFQSFNIFLTYSYVEVWGIPATALLWRMPVVRLIGAFEDPLMGLIADRTQTRWGKFRPYLVWGEPQHFQPLSGFVRMKHEGALVRGLSKSGRLDVQKPRFGGSTGKDGQLTKPGECSATVNRWATCGAGVVFVLFRHNNNQNPTSL